MKTNGLRELRNFLSHPNMDHRKKRFCLQIANNLDRKEWEILFLVWVPSALALLLVELFVSTLSYELLNEALPNLHRYLIWRAKVKDFIWTAERNDEWQ